MKGDGRRKTGGGKGVGYWRTVNACPGSTETETNGPTHFGLRTCHKPTNLPMLIPKRWYQKATNPGSRLKSRTGLVQVGRGVGEASRQRKVKKLLQHSKQPPVVSVITNRVPRSAVRIMTPEAERFRGG